jgi:hypothetical protein
MKSEEDIILEYKLSDVCIKKQHGELVQLFKNYIKANIKTDEDWAYLPYEWSGWGDIIFQLIFKL